MDGTIERIEKLGWYLLTDWEIRRRKKLATDGRISYKMYSFHHGCFLQFGHTHLLDDAEGVEEVPPKHQRVHWCVHGMNPS